MTFKNSPEENILIPSGCWALILIIGLAIGFSWFESFGHKLKISILYPRLSLALLAE
jgi:hypothetical protein